MKGWRLSLFLVLGIFLFIIAFIFLGQYKLARIKSSSGKLIGLWLTSQLFLDKDMDIISKKFEISSQKKQEWFKIRNVNKDQTNINFSNSGVYYKCLDELNYELINVYIDENAINSKRLSSNLYYIVLRCMFSNLVDDNQTNEDIGKTDLINYLMRISSNKNVPFLRGLPTSQGS